MKKFFEKSHEFHLKSAVFKVKHLQNPYFYLEMRANLQKMWVNRLVG